MKVFSRTQLQEDKRDRRADDMSAVAERKYREDGKV